MQFDGGGGHSSALLHISKYILLFFKCYVQNDKLSLLDKKQKFDLSPSIIRPLVRLPLIAIDNSLICSICSMYIPS